MNQKLVDLLQELSKLPHADDLRVFGSMATDKEDPSDIDVCLLAPDCSTLKDVLQRYTPTPQKMLGLAARHFGGLDPFILCNEGLIVRNDVAGGWTYARNATVLTKAIKAGVPMKEVLTLRGIVADVEEPEPRHVELNIELPILLSANAFARRYPPRMPPRRDVSWLSTP